MALYKHQQDLLDKNPEKHLLAWGTGTGKTLTSIFLAKKNSGGALYIVPKALVSQWSDNVNGAIYKHPSPGISTKIEVSRIMTKEQFRKEWDEIEKFDVVVVDEAHYFFGMKSQMSKALAGYFKKHHTKYRYLLTATPYLSTPWNIFMAAQLLGHHPNYTKWKYEFFNEIRMGRRMVPVVKSGIETQIADIVNTIGNTVRLEDCVDVPEQVFEVENLELTEHQKKAVSEVTDIMPIVRFTKHHQIENGHLKGNEYEEDRIFASYKTDRIISLVSENQKIAIVCRYNGQIGYLKGILEKEFPTRKVYIISGDVKDRAGTVEAVNADPSAIVLIQAACSEGYELPTIRTIVFASMSFSFKDYRQMLGRFLRINALHKNLFITLLAGPVDTAVHEAIQKKEDFDIAIYAQSK